MLDIDKSTVDFLVTENMVQEVEKVLSHDVPLVHTIVEEMVKRDIDRIYFVACGSPLNAGANGETSGGSLFRSSGLRHFRLGVLR
ncbi:fructoselysine-6-P-deglycase [Escherichia coli]|nr:fructoselysine-6-P-deglycase [Escherichia coli]